MNDARTDDALVNATLEHAARVVHRLKQALPRDGGYCGISADTALDQAAAAIRAEKTPEG